ncbi:hypothetical protein PIB30_077055 [Stylosanthes scabra]|uniref:Putative plant transposon protein domain-containing protein n=1 Tax=Stylosanthes scabra TaxID=79078 RepID=A0ABU6WNQ5_9FABA|nr:hypothetical protein [Stylosanthes scabra]
MEEAGGHTFRSYVRGKVVDFSPENLRNVMRFGAHVQIAATDFETRKEHDQQLDQVLTDLCIPGATWKLSTSQLRVPIQLRQQELNPVARSEIPVIRAILIHCIMRGEDVRVEDIIADKIVRMALGIKEKGKLGFPSTIFKLCKEAGVPIREFRRTRKIQAKKPIIAKRMESTRLPRPIQRRQQENEDEDEPMPQAEEGNEEGNEGQAHDYDYHHQPEYEHHQLDYEQSQPEFEHLQEFNEPPVQPPPYHIKNYQVNQTLVDSTRHKAYMDELAAMKAKQEEFFSNQANQYNLIRQDHKLLGKEILDVKKYQMSAVTMGSSGSGSSTQPPPPPPYEPDQALMKIREQHATFTEICRKLHGLGASTS